MRPSDPARTDIRPAPQLHSGDSGYAAARAASLTTQLDQQT